MSSDLKIEEIEYGGWGRNLRLSNDDIELVVTLEVGPRILHCAPRGGRNLFCVFSDQLGTSGETSWQSRGGHRFWTAPESAETDSFTYFPDNAPVEYQVAENRVLFMPPPEQSNGWQKEIEISLDGPRVHVTHRIKNISDQPITCAPWALSVMAPGGVAIVPQPGLGSHPENLLPNRAMILWPYTDFTDPRLKLGSRFWTLEQHASRGPIKIGLNLGGETDGSGTTALAIYALDDVWFIKQFARDPHANYPDGGCNCELFTNEEMLEVETLGPLVELAPGARAEHREQWFVVTGMSRFRPGDEKAISAAMSKALNALTAR